MEVIPANARQLSAILSANHGGTAPTYDACQLYVPISCHQDAPGMKPRLRIAFRRSLVPAILARRRYITTLPARYVQVSEEVKQAISDHRPVVALESTIYTHGFPYPENVALASSLESIVRTLGATPATIGILDGIARVGLSYDELLRLAASSQDNTNLLKVSRRDLGFALGTRSGSGSPYNGGTTVAGTMLLAHLAGIKIFATGGLGGVHRGAETTYDVSADLTELGRTPVAVVAAGCKAFLDIPKTLEYLETQGVGVITFADGRTGEVDFPGFWSRNSGHRSPMTIRGPTEAAAIIHAQRELHMQSGLLFGNPVPSQHEIPLPKIQNAIDQALSEAAKAGAIGNKATPFILAKIKELTGAQSVRANTALVESNVTAGTKIAIELAKLENDVGARQPLEPTQTTRAAPKSSLLSAASDSGITATDQVVPSPTVFVAGMLAVDFACDYEPRSHAKNRPMEMATSNPSRVTQSLGGVGHNVALAAHRSGAVVRFCSAVGDDMNGKSALGALRLEGFDLSCIEFLPGRRTAQYVAVNDAKKDLVVAMADMTTLDGEDILDTIRSEWKEELLRHKPTLLVIDANWSPRHLLAWLDIAKASNVSIVYEPVSNAKSTAIFKMPAANDQTQAETLGVFPHASITLVTPNASELTSMYETARQNAFFESQSWWEVVDAFGISSAGARAQMVLATTASLVDQGIPQKSLQLLPYMPCITTKLGAQGVLLTQIIPHGDPRLISSEYAPHMLSRCNNGTENTIGVGGVYMRLFPPPEEVSEDEVVSVNGVGDTFAGVLVTGMANQKKQEKGIRVEDLIDVAQRASILTLKSTEAVSPGLGTLSMLI